MYAWSLHMTIKKVGRWIPFKENEISKEMGCEAFPRYQYDREGRSVEGGISEGTESHD